MKSLFLDPTTDISIQAFKKDTPQSLLISGPLGSGLQTIAKLLSTDVTMMISPEKDGKINIEDGTIGVELIRNLYNDTRAKSKGVSIIIKDADKMTVQAQNAFLKLLEEPNAGIHFILLSHNDTSILPTIKSRAERLEVRPINNTQSKQLLNNLGITDNTKCAQILFLASGLPSAITRLATDPSYFKTRSSITHDARDMLQSNRYTKLKLAQKYKDKRRESLLLLDDMIKILRYTLSKNQQSEIILGLNDILDTYQNISQNGNIMLNLAKLVL